MHPIRRWLRSTPLRLAVGLVVVCAVLEQRARVTAERLGLDKPFWYRSAVERVVREPVAVFVLGSSRVALAVNEERLAGHLSARLGRPAVVIDLGLGYSVWTEHALGVQRLIDAAPGRVRGAVVLIEAPSGRPPVGSWRQWYHPFSPGLLSLVLRGSDLPALWRSGEVFDRKVAITLAWAGSASSLVRHRRALRDEAFNSVRERVFGQAEEEVLADTLGGTRKNPRVLLDTKLRTVLQGIGLAETAPPGAASPVEHLVRIAARAGMVPLLLQVPEYPGRADTGGYAAAPHEAGRPPLGDIALIRPAAQFTVEDIPDRVHLRPSASDRFTDALADALVASGRMPAAGKR